MNTIDAIQEIIDNGKRIVFFTGAGVSTDSGIPDFRSQDGLYHTKYAYPPEEILSHTFFMHSTEEFYRFYRDKMLYPDVQPNYVHTFIAKLEEMGKSLGVVTQNIDGLHQKAGSKHVYELHGSVSRNYCTKCHQFYDESYILNTSGIPKCPSCGGIIKPDVVLYEEPLNNEVVTKAVETIQKADVLIVMGTSLVVYPAAGLIRYFYGDKLVLINKDATPYDNMADLAIHSSFSAILPKFKL